MGSFSMTKIDSLLILSAGTPRTEFLMTEKYENIDDDYQFWDLEMVYNEKADYSIE